MRYGRAFALLILSLVLAFVISACSENPPIESDTEPPYESESESETETENESESGSETESEPLPPPSSGDGDNYTDEIEAVLRGLGSSSSRLEALSSSTLPSENIKNWTDAFSEISGGFDQVRTKAFANAEVNSVLL